jgi:hypothetical protein
MEFLKFSDDIVNVSKIKVIQTRYDFDFHTRNEIKTYRIIMDKVNYVNISKTEDIKILESFINKI